MSLSLWEEGHCVLIWDQDRAVELRDVNCKTVSKYANEKIKSITHQSSIAKTPLLFNTFTILQYLVIMSEFITVSAVISSWMQIN